MSLGRFFARSRLKLTSCFSRLGDSFLRLIVEIGIVKCSWISGLLQGLSTLPSNTKLVRFAPQFEDLTELSFLPEQTSKNPLRLLCPKAVAKRVLAYDSPFFHMLCLSIKMLVIIKRPSPSFGMGGNLPRKVERHRFRVHRRLCHDLHACLASIPFPPPCPPSDEKVKVESAQGLERERCLRLPVKLEVIIRLYNQVYVLGLNAENAAKTQSIER